MMMPRFSFKTNKQTNPKIFKKKKKEKSKHAAGRPAVRTGRGSAAWFTRKNDNNAQNRGYVDDVQQ
jgi:hypothetical protein